MQAVLPLVIAVVGLTSPVAAQAAIGRAENNSVSVTGEAEVKVVPDEVILRLGVETGDRDLSLAKKLNDERVARAPAAAQKHEIERTSRSSRDCCLRGLRARIGTVPPS